MIQFPRISIITPSYNQARYVGWTARSVFLQRYPTLEYILMDGGSKDDTVKVLEPYRDRFAYFTSERDKGQSDAVHRGLQRATGDILAYLNSDDMLAPGALHFVADFFRRNPDVDVVYSHRVTVDSNNKALYYWMLPRHWTWYQLRWDLIPQETTFWRRRLFEQCGNVDPTFRFALDYDLFSRFMTAGARFERVNRFLGVFRTHEEAKTTQWLNTIGEDEISLVRQRNGITFGGMDRFISARVFYGVWRNGEKFAAQKRKLPGALPGVGYDYDQCWGGLLNSDVPLPPLVDRNY
jgi:glycosyltransferase involved in cell wall biosynthesis